VAFKKVQKIASKASKFLRPRKAVTAVISMDPADPASAHPGPLHLM